MWELPEMQAAGVQAVAGGLAGIRDNGDSYGPLVSEPPGESGGGLVSWGPLVSEPPGSSGSSSSGGEWVSLVRDVVRAGGNLGVEILRASHPQGIYALNPATGGLLRTTSLFGPGGTI